MAVSIFEIYSLHVIASEGENVCWEVHAPRGSCVTTTWKIVFRAAKEGRTDGDVSSGCPCKTNIGEVSSFFPLYFSPTRQDTTAITKWTLEKKRTMNLFGFIDLFWCRLVTDHQTTAPSTIPPVNNLWESWSTASQTAYIFPFQSLFPDAHLSSSSSTNMTIS